MSDSGVTDLPTRIQQAKGEIRRHLDTQGGWRSQWLFSLFVGDPIRVKNLEKAAGLLDRIAHCLMLASRGGNAAPEPATSLPGVLEQFANPAQLCSNNAWEYAHRLELELIRVADDPYLITLLDAALADPAMAAMASPRVGDLRNTYQDGAFTQDHARAEVRRLLEHIQQTRIDEYRRDRGKARLRGIYLGRMALILLILLAALGTISHILALGSDTAPGTQAAPLGLLLALAATAGALGSVLSRSVKLGKQPLHEGANPETAGPPLGIRALLSGWPVLVAQPFIGAAAGVVVFLPFYGRFLSIGSYEPTWEFYALLSFLAGFSEPFFLKVLDRVAGEVDRP